MKSYIIYLPNFANSVRMANIAESTAIQHRWNVELFPGVNGLINSIDDFEIFANNENAKCREAMKRPGVQGCLLSHWLLWKHCITVNEAIGIFEHDTKFLAPFDESLKWLDVLKLEGFDLKKARPAGAWYEGTRAYAITPSGAKKLLDWIALHGCLPSDVQIGCNIVDIQLCDQQLVIQQELHQTKQSKREQSFTWNLENIKI
jgi:GR25 family glycosyltransferase involved in LPS biosynthesis